LRQKISLFIEQLMVGPGGFEPTAYAIKINKGKKLRNALTDFVKATYDYCMSVFNITEHPALTDKLSVIKPLKNLHNLLKLFRLQLLREHS